MDENAIVQFVKDRNEALFSLDEKKIRAYAEKYRVALPDNDVAFWGGIYKAICNITNAPKDVQDKARAWLKEHDMSETI